MITQEFNLWKSLAVSMLIHLVFFAFMAVRIHTRRVHYWLATPVELVNVPAADEKEVPVTDSKPVEEEKKEIKPEAKKTQPKSQSQTESRGAIKIKPKEKIPKKEEKASAGIKPKEIPPAASVVENKEKAERPATQSTIIPDVVDFPYLYYLNIIQKTVEKNLPRIGKALPKQTVIYFKILRNGQVQEAMVAHSCGSDSVDQLALGAVLRSSPFQGLPREYKEEALAVHYRFTWGE